MPQFLQVDLKSSLTRPREMHVVYSCCSRLILLFVLGIAVVSRKTPLSQRYLFASGLRARIAQSRPSNYVRNPGASLNGLAFRSLTLLLLGSLHPLLLADGVLLTTGLSLLLELLLTLDLSLLLVDGLDQDILVLVLVTLGSGVHAMVHGLVDFARVAVSA